MTDQQPSREELMARLQDLHTRAVDLRDRANAQRSGPRWGALAAVIGLPLCAGIATGMMTGSILFGSLAGVAVFVVVVMIGLRNAPASTRPGTRAWEAKLTAELLERVIAERSNEKHRTPDATRRDRLDREIAFLTNQLAESSAIWQSNDPSPGKGYIGFTPYEGQ